MSVKPSSSNATGKQKTKRRKAIAKIEDSSALQVSFCKRRRGLFHKAAELSVLTGAEIAVVTFSPAGKPFHFASNSDINSIINKYSTSGNISSTPLAINVNIDGENQNPREDIEEHHESTDEGWWDSVDIEELRSMEEIEVYAKAIEDKLRDLKEKNKIMTMVVDGDDSSAGHVFNDGGASSGANANVEERGTTFYEWL